MGASCTASRRGVMVSVAWVEPETAEARNRNRDDAAGTIPAIFIFPDSVVSEGLENCIAVKSTIMQLGFMSAIVPELSLEEVFALGNSIGYKCVELMCWPPGKADRRYSGVTHIDVSNFNGADASRVSDLAKDRGMEISGLGYYPNLLSPDQEEAKVA